MQMEEIKISLELKVTTVGEKPVFTKTQLEELVGVLRVAAPSIRIVEAYADPKAALIVPLGVEDECQVVAEILQEYLGNAYEVEDAALMAIVSKTAP